MSVDLGPESIPLAIIGMGCRLPGADGLKEFWQLVVEGRSAVREMPADRMDRSLYFDPQVGVRGKSYSTLAATLSSREFDHEACPIPEELARSVDNVHLLMCGVAAAALRHAGIDPFDVSLRNTGVYIGHAQGSELGCDYTYATCVGEAAEFLREVPDFQQLPAAEQDTIIRTLVSEVRCRLPQRTPEAADVSACMVAGTISKAFGLNGPFLAINSACASSLQAMLLGARALQLGHIDMAIVGGASDCKGDTLVLFSHAQAMSSTGSRPFDADADGLIVGEGYAAVVMKRMDRALADGDNVLAIVRGLGISSDGKGKSLWAPRKEGQIKAMERAYRCGVELSGLQYLEAHSTATQLGDATELNTLSEVLAPHFPTGHKIPVTSVKANIGHTLETAGLAGVIKSVLAMQHGVIPPAINIRERNRNIDWDNAPVFVPTEASPWPSPENGQPRRAGVNAFGIGGLNMHVVLDEYTESARLLLNPGKPSSPVRIPQDDDDAIAVIGRGCILPGAANLTEYWRLLQTGEDPKQHVPADRWRSDLAFKPHSREAFMTPCTLGGFVTGYEHDWRRHKIPPKQIQQADPLQFMLLDAMDEAFTEAGYDHREFDRTRVGVVVGTEFGGDFAFQLQLGLRIPELRRILLRLLGERGFTAAQAEAAVDQYAETLLKHWPALIDESGSFSTSTLASRLGKTWNLMGGAAAIDAGDASSLSALAISADMLLARDCDMMVCAGAQRRMGLPEYETLSLKGMLPQQEPRSPLDAQCDGYVPGEGVGVVLLKRLADARRDGDPIHTVIRGIAAGHARDGAEAMRLAMARSFAISHVEAASVSVVEVDATDSRTTSERQLTAIVESQRAAGRERPLLVGSVASLIGHTQGAAGMASLLKASLEVSHGEVPPVQGVSQPAAPITQDGGALRVAESRTSLTSASSDVSPVGAVVSSSRGLTYQAIIEARAAVAREGAGANRQPASGAEPRPHAQEEQAPTAVSPGAGPMADIAGLESFLINFVVEQTGYPPEVVELDADLEADLGIDSIKKAQLFGELQEYFDITPTAGLTLDDFPTLRHIVSFLAEFGGQTQMPPSPTTAAEQSTLQEQSLPVVTPAAAATVSSLPAAHHVEGRTEPVVAQTNGERLAAPPASSLSAASSPSSAATSPPSAGIADLETFLINFVVEQTGYPKEVVELDADLEADLGIDSIKKAQLFGELQEYFDIAPTGDVTLDDFPTLRHVLDFLAANSAPHETVEASSSLPSVGSTATVVNTLSTERAASVVGGRGSRRAEGVESFPLGAAQQELRPPQPQPTVASRVGVSPTRVPERGAWRIFRCAGSSWEEIQQQFDDARAHPAVAFERSAGGPAFSARDRFRAAVVANGPEGLTRKLEQARPLLTQPNARRPLENQGVFVREVRPQGTRIAFVFPGQGSQSTGMLRSLVEHDPTAQAAVRGADSILAQLGEDSFAQIAWGSDSPLGTDVWTTQLSMLLADYVMFRVLQQRGITPDLVLGHSYGEYAALLAAESWDLAEAIRVTRARCDAIESSPTVQGGMLATTATPDEITTLARQLADRVYIANLNAPDQTVVGGKRPVLRELERLLKAESFHTRLLAVPCAFHTPLLEEAAVLFEASLRAAQIESPRLAAYSVANNRLVTSADDVRRNLVAHLTHPVRYMDLIQQIDRDATTVFVEVGPQQALTRLNARILADADLIGCDHPKRSGIEQLVHVQALLEVCGAIGRPARETSEPVRVAEIVHFDATARRRAKMRDAAQQKQGGAAIATADSSSAVPMSSQAVVAPVSEPVASVGGGAATELPLPPRSVSEPFPPALQPHAPLRPVSDKPVAVAEHASPPTGRPSADRIASTPPTTDIVDWESTRSTAAAPTADDSKAAGPAKEDLESFLVNFVVEQTGYPPEVVELDADLEADLGIDSIKKAQLFGELQEYFDIAPSEGLTLDDFPTLRHVVRFLSASMEHDEPAASAVSATASATATVPTSEPSRAEPVEALSSGANGSRVPSDSDETSPPPPVTAPVAPSHDILLVQLRGTPFEIGCQHGTELKDPIRRALRRIADLSNDGFDELPIPQKVIERPERYFARELMDELRGIAEGADVSLGSLLAWNLCLLSELGTSATHVAVCGSETVAGPPLHGLRDDLCLMGSLSACLTPIVQIRQVADQIPTACATFAGFVGALVGLNAHGVCLSGLATASSGRREDGLPGRHLLLVAQVLGTAAEATKAVATLQQQSEGEWRCCVSQEGADEVFLLNRGGGRVTVQPHADVVHVEADGADADGKRSDNADDSGDGWSTATMLTALENDQDEHGRHCVVIVDSAAGEIHVGCGAGRLAGRLTRVPVAPFLEPVEDGVSTASERPDRADAPQTSASYDLPDVETRTKRFVMTMVPAALPPNTESNWRPKGPVIVLGHNPTADALAERMASEDVPVHRLATSSVDEAVAQLEDVWRHGPAPHMFLMTARDSEPGDLNDPVVWQRAWDQQVLLPFYVCQRWLQLAHEARRIDDCTVVALTNLGGDFGFESDVHVPHSGALTGLMKALCLEYYVLREHKGFLAKAIDAPFTEDPGGLVDSVCVELASGAIDYEVAYVNGGRFLQVAVPRPAGVQEHAEIRPGSTWVVTGGARGITAESALELGRRFNLKLHLIGSSPAPRVPPEKRDLDSEGLDRWRSEIMIAARERGEKPNEAWEQVRKSLEMDRALRRFSAADMRATYHSCDVGDREALAAVLEEIRRADGPIEGILHGAGIERPCRFEKKTPENVRATLDAKVAGAYHLMTLTREDPIRHFVAYGSISGRLGSNGQTDYCAASDMLCKLASWYRRQRHECRTIAFHWHPWDEVGMAARPEARASLERTNGPALMPKAEGIRHLFRELYSPQENCEVLITDWEFHQRYYPEEVRHGGPSERNRPEHPGASETGPGTSEQKPESTKAEVTRVASRHVLRLEEASLIGPATTPLSGSALILGENAAAACLRDRLVAQGVRTHLLPAVDAQQAIQQLEAIWAAEPCRALFLMEARETDVFSLPEGDSLSQLTEQRVLLPYLVTQRWVQLLAGQEWNEPAVVAAATSLGGAFGCDGTVPIPSPESGALCGLLKSIHVEHVRDETRRFVVKVIDSPPDESADSLAESICREVTSGTPEVEVAWDRGRRRVVRCRREAIKSTQPVLPRRGGVWVVTGGARGITAATALDLGRRYGLKLHLIGKSPAPQTNAEWRNVSDAELKVIKRSIVMRAVSEGRSPEEDWDRVRKDREIFDSLQSFENAGVAVTYHSCDVADAAALEATLQEIRETDGPVEGIIHGAGYAKSARFESQAIDRVRRTLAPKIGGTIALMSLTRQDPLKHFIAFGSLSGRFGGNGLADYAAANDMLAKLCDWFREERPDCRTTCFHWQTWDRIGMAMIADGTEITKTAFKMDFLSPEEGIAHLHDELCAGLPDGEILITDGFFQQIFYPPESLETVNGTEGDSAAEPRVTDSSATRSVPRPLIDRWEPDATGDSATASILFAPAADPFLTQHRLRDKPFLPGVVGIEALLEAADARDSSHEIRAIRDVEITNGLLFRSEDPVTATVRVTPRGESLECRLTTELRNRRGRVVDPQRLHVAGIVDLAETEDRLPQDPPGRPLGWFPHQYADDGLLTHGPAFRCLTDIAYQYDGGWGRIVAPSPSELAGERNNGEGILPLAVLDACLVTCGSFVFLQFGGEVEVPHGFEQLRWWRQPRPDEVCIVRTYFRDRDAKHSRFDFTLYGEQNEPLLQAAGYRTIRMGGKS